MAELRRRKGDGDTAADGDGTAAAPTLVAAAVGELLREKQQLPVEALNLSDSATADSSDHVGVYPQPPFCILPCVCLHIVCAYCVCVDEPRTRTDDNGPVIDFMCMRI